MEFLKSLFSFLAKIFTPKGAQRRYVLLVVLAVVVIFLGTYSWAKPWNIFATKFNNAIKVDLLGTYSPKNFSLGLDLHGGVHLVYQADVANIAEKDRDSALSGVRDVIERRINLYGVSEPNVQIDKVGGDYRLIVDLAGVTDINQAIKLIGETPYLDFRTEKPGGATTTADFIPSALNGKNLKKATLSFDQTTYKPQVDLQFDSEGAKLFAEITKANLGKRVGIFLDGVPISIPVVQSEITGGNAQITGNFTTDEAKLLVQRLNAGALPVAIKLISQQNIAAQLGGVSLAKSLKAGLYGFLAVVIFMILLYRFSGFLASLALFIYAIIVLAIFKFIPVTLTLSGIAGFVMTIGIAVDANVLVFERMREESRNGKSLVASLEDGFSRAWPSIRDSNISTLITSIILFWFGSSIIRGFALTLAVGIVVSMFSAMVITRLLMRVFVNTKLSKFTSLWTR
jgi:preprotein translocase subunit SecD